MEIFGIIGTRISVIYRKLDNVYTRRYTEWSNEKSAPIFSLLFSAESKNTCRRGKEHILETCFNPFL